MAEGLTGAGDFELEVLDLVTVSGMRIDLTASCMGITIFEDIFSLALTGTIALTDSFNLPSHGPILGQEYLYLKIRTPSFPDATTTAIDFSENVFLIHSISTRKALGSGVQGYVLSFASQELIKNQRLKVTQSLTGSWSDLVEQMIRDSKYLNTTKNVLIERTAGVKRFVAPNIRPLDVVVLATKQAISQKGGEPTFLFYETFDGFHFQSLASLYNKLPSFLFKTVQPGANPPLGRRGDIAKQMETILSYEIVNNNDTIVGYRTGMYGSKLITHDIVNKTYKINRYNYHDNFTSEPHIVSGTTAERSEYPFVSELYVNQEGRVSDYLGRTFVMPETNSSINKEKDSQHATTANTSPFSSYNPSSWIQRRNSQMLQLENAFNINLRVHGNTMVRVGKVVTVKIPYVQASSVKREEPFDKFYNGPFLIKRIRHDFSMTQSPQKHIMNMNLVKDSLEEQLPNPVDNMEPSAQTYGSKIDYNYADI